MVLCVWLGVDAEVGVCDPVDVIVGNDVMDGVTVTRAVLDGVTVTEAVTVDVPVDLAVFEADPVFDGVPD